MFLIVAAGNAKVLVNASVPDRDKTDYTCGRCFRQEPRMFPSTHGSKKLSAVDCLLTPTVAFDQRGILVYCNIIPFFGDAAGPDYADTRNIAESSKTD